MSLFNKVTKSFQWGDKTVVMETGEIARQASGAVLVEIDGTVVLATVAASKSAKPGQDFFPLTVDYIEKTYAAGKIPGSFFKREAKPSELETLTSRLIDRPIRPLFPDGFFNEVHVVIHTLSLNPEVDADIAAMIGVSAAMSASTSGFSDSVWMTTCTSLKKPSGNSGRIGRSIRRLVRVSCSLGLASRLKKLPGILPAAYVFSM